VSRQTKETDMGSTTAKKPAANGKGRTKDLPGMKPKGGHLKSLDGKNTVKGEVPIEVSAAAGQLAKAKDEEAIVLGRIDERKDALKAAMKKNRVTHVTVQGEHRPYTFDLETLERLHVKRERSLKA